jgi:hypothetical protein
VNARNLAAVLVGVTLSSTALAADDLSVRIDHDVVELGADGVTRITRFSERLVRRDRQSWIARVMPPGAHEDAQHRAGGKGHRHLDLASASRWVALGDDGTLRVRLVSAHDKVVVDVPPADWANVGFDGRWTSASRLLDPDVVARMSASARSAPAGARWVEGIAAGARVQVLWDESARYPRRIESANARGTRRSTMVVTREPMPEAMPWATLAGYVHKEYADLLD